MLDKLKGAYKSVVIWFNGITLSLMSLFELFHESMPELSQYIPDNVYRVVGAVVLVVNIALRFKTRTGLENK